jgi:alpha-methylacyl-CoA racemase
MAAFMLPRYVRIVAELPLTPTQKIEKHVLRAQGITGDTWDRVAAGLKTQRQHLAQRKQPGAGPSSFVQQKPHVGSKPICFINTADGGGSVVAKKLESDARDPAPLRGISVLEFAGLGPAPFCGMLLSDMGADVIRIDRPGTAYTAADVEARGRRSAFIDLKTDAGKQQALALLEQADILIEGYRPGVMERLGLGPELALQHNPRLVYGRMTGWGQQGPLAHKAGHDLNYLALSGALHALGTSDKPAVPLNLIADFGGGALYLAMGVLAALQRARQSGRGAVVDAAMTDGVISMLGMIYGDFAEGRWLDQRESNVIDGAAPFYNVYKCADARWLSLAAIEPQFYSTFLRTAPLTDGLFAHQWERSLWPQQKQQLEEFFSGRSRDEWCEHFAAHDVCIAPVLSLAEAREHPHNRARNAFIERDGIVQPAPAPRFS